MRGPKSARIASVGTAVGVRELRDHLSRYLEQVKAGEPITITEHGRPVAQIVGTQYPVRLLELASQGRLTLASRPRRPAREFPRIPFDGSVADLVDEVRDE